MPLSECQSIVTVEEMEMITCLYVSAIPVWFTPDFVQSQMLSWYCLVVLSPRQNPRV
jgi:hypothetical protein